MTQGLPECPRCRGPSVPRFFHPDAPEGEACERFNPRGTADQLRCLGCGWRFRGTLDEALDALDEVQERLREHPDALQRMGDAWRERMARDRAKFDRAMRGEW